MARRDKKEMGFCPLCLIANKAGDIENRMYKRFKDLIERERPELSGNVELAKKELKDTIHYEAGLEKDIKAVDVAIKEVRKLKSSKKEKTARRKELRGQKKDLELKKETEGEERVFCKMSLKQAQWAYDSELDLLTETGLLGGRYQLVRTLCKFMGAYHPKCVACGLLFGYEHFAVPEAMTDRGEICRMCWAEWEKSGVSAFSYGSDNGNKTPIITWAKALRE